MSTDELRQGAATNIDLPRLVATTSDSDYSLSIEDALVRYEQAGVPRTPRSIQRYCAKGDLDCHRIETPFSAKFLITPASVDRHIAYINEVRLVATSRGMSRQMSLGKIKGLSCDKELRQAATTRDNPRQAATSTDEPRQTATDNRYVARLESENEFLRGQIAVKDEQIKEQTTRARETDILIDGLQKMIAPLLSGPERGE